MHVFRRVIIFSLAILSLAGCDYMPFGYTPIGEINRSPGRYETQEIKVKGTVTDISKLPFLDFKTYILQDDTGEITVVTMDALPAVDETVAIKANVKTAAILGKESFGLRLEEVEKLPSL